MNIFKRMLPVAVVVAMLAGCGVGVDSTERALTEEQAAEQVESYISTGDVEYTSRNHEPDDSWVGVDSTTEDLPEIDKYPLSVEGQAKIDVEVFSSTEKSNAKQDRWLDGVARKFNDSGATIDGQRVSVSVRPIASGLALDYITSGKYVPEGYSPANELWAAMIDSTGVKTQMVENRLTGNTAGILMKEDVYNTFITKYGQLTMENVVEAVMAGELKLGHTDPNQSSTGLNILTQELVAFDAANPLSPTAAKMFREFQTKVPPTSPTTDEMAKVASKGLMDAMIMESQALKTQPSLATGWVFTPVGVRHDSPLYALGNLPTEEAGALKLFADFAVSSESQKAATSFGFNEYDGYSGKPSQYSGAQLYGALDLWKQNKDSGQPVVSVFVIDRSGSMDGQKLDRAKQALRSSAAHINPDNYVGLVSYAGPGEIAVDLPVGQFDDPQRSKFVGAVNSLETGGGTATNSALIVALKLMLDAKKDIPDAKLRVIVMTDGEQNEGLRLPKAIEVVAGLRVPVYSVGFEATLADLEKLAEPNEAYTINADREDGVAKLIALVRGTL